LPRYPVFKFCIQIKMTSGLDCTLGYSAVWNGMVINFTASHTFFFDYGNEFVSKCIHVPYNNKYNMQTLSIADNRS
jgi:hypothetical protein